MARVPRRGPSRSKCGLLSKMEGKGESPGRPGCTACMGGNRDPGASQACGWDWPSDLRQISGPVRTSATSPAAGRQEPARWSSTSSRDSPSLPLRHSVPNPPSASRTALSTAWPPSSPAWPASTPCPASGSSSHVLPCLPPALTLKVSGGPCAHHPSKQPRSPIHCSQRDRKQERHRHTRDTCHSPFWEQLCGTHTPHGSLPW